jgi:hypothetical protein
VLIDGGPTGVYRPQLLPRLAQIRQARGLGPDASLPVDLLMVSHIDDDHIKGILELTRQLVNAGDSGQPLPVKIKAVWHNTFDDILHTTPDELLAAVTASFGPAALTGEPAMEGLAPETAGVLASVGQGRQLRDDVRNKLHADLNPGFAGRLIMAAAGTKPVTLKQSLKLTVVGPMKAELVALQKEHDDWLKEKGTAEAALAAFTDDSVSNLSSVVVLAQSGGKRILLTGDARGDRILEGLELVGALKKKGSLHVDILKMPHHGSARNVEPVFFRRLTADHYVFSGNGQNGNPERETLRMLLDQRGKASYTVHLTYPVDQIDVEREKDWESEQRKERGRKKKNRKLKVRPDWSAKKHGLKAFLAEHPAFARKIRIVPEHAPHVIDLLDPLGF